MNCHVCGGLMEAQVTDLPFKLDQHTIRIIKELPVLECKQCGETLIEAQVMAQVEPLLGTDGRRRHAGSARAHHDDIDVGGPGIYATIMITARHICSSVSHNLPHSAVSRLHQNLGVKHKMRARAHTEAEARRC